MTKITPSGVKYRSESTKPGSCKIAKIGFLLLYSVFRGNLLCFHMKQQHITLSSTQPVCSLTTLKSPEALVTTHSRTVALFRMPFYACTMKHNPNSRSVWLGSKN